MHYDRVDSPVLPPVLVPRFSDPLPPEMADRLLPFQQIPEPHMPQNVYYNQNGFNSPPILHHMNQDPLSPGMSSGGIPSPGPVRFPHKIAKKNVFQATFFIGLSSIATNAW